ncbi:MAG: hypothetical protein AB8B58_11970 [Roseobacter sp.]
MLQRHPPPGNVTSEHEDAELFKTQAVQITVELIPQTRHTCENSLVIRGYVEKYYEIDVVFADTHRHEATRLEEHLQASLEAGRTQAAQHERALEINLIRCPVHIEGSWRRLSVRDANDWEARSYHFLAARWTWVDPNGTSGSFGAPPVVHPTGNQDI